MPVKENSQFTPKNTATNSLDSLNSLPSNQKPTGLVNIVGSLLPLAPVLFEQWTGQKIPPLTGTLAEMQSNLSSLSLNVQQVLQNQSQIYQALQSLQTSAQSSLSQLTSQVSQIQSLRLTHSREKREIELGSNNVSDFDKSRQYNPTSQEEEY